VSEQERDLAAGAALGALSAEDAARLDADVARSPELAAHLEEYRATVSMLEATVGRERPPADLFDGVLERIEAEAVPAPVQEEPARGRERRRERSWRLWPAFAAGAAAAAAVALVLVLAGGDDLGTPDARAAVQGTEDFPGVRGEARLYRAGQEDGVVVVALDDVPTPGSGEHYEVWVLRKEAGGAMEAVGVFTPTTASVDLEFRLPGPGDYEAVDVSVEEDGGPAAHSGTSLAGGVFEQAA
jgi:anti-sigma-K factor RskA